MRRDDPVPAPWTKEGKKRIESLGLEMQVHYKFNVQINYDQVQIFQLKISIITVSYFIISIVMSAKLNRGTNKP